MMAGKGINDAPSGAGVFISFPRQNLSALLSGMAVREQTHPNDKFESEWQDCAAGRTFLKEEEGVEKQVGGRCRGHL